jgi:hypothetical protein
MTHPVSHQTQHILCGTGYGTKFIGVINWELFIGIIKKRSARAVTGSTGIIKKRFFAVTGSTEERFIGIIKKRFFAATGRGNDKEKFFCSNRHRPRQYQGQDGTKQS